MMQSNKVGETGKAQGAYANEAPKKQALASVGKGYLIATSREALEGLKQMGPKQVVAFAVGTEVRYVKANSAAQYEKSLKKSGQAYVKLNDQQFSEVTWGGSKASVGANVVQKGGKRAGGPSSVSRQVISEHLSERFKEKASAPTPQAREHLTRQINVAVEEKLANIKQKAGQPKSPKSLPNTSRNK
ncbi:hypothetical protein FBR05_03555 [Deltaproteobacteria bacterium PRO3]|nr:hypothetical protein [Deltaproteobacteria bacterium PRO3]